MTRARVPILMYHSVADRPNNATRALSVSPEAFAEQMAVIADRGLTPLSTADLAARWRTGRPLPARPVLITFDDGYEGVHRHALPALAGHGFPATLFVSTGWIKGAHDTGGGLDTMLDWPQVRRLADAGVEIGGHSHSHPQLDQLDDLALRTELTRCRDIVADELGAPPVSFAYPYGYSSRRVRTAVRAHGFAQALAVGNSLARRAQGPYALRRVTVRCGTDAEEFERLLDGRTIGRTFARDRMMTKGYAVVRRTRRLRRRAVDALV
ncbi:polysaccharide deacetylase family protein [Streptomyces sp. NPDC049687]|uniref:polysaccharide deacetylase family protein n=1 Tax=Streptomyces sp. NPDC049687 TaxID=3365596 RepID=UPI0037905BA0